MKRLLLSSIFLLVVLYATIIYSATGTPSTLIVKTDANNYLLVTSATQTNPVTQGVFNSRTLRTDSSGSLQVVLTGTVTPTYPLSIPASTCAAPSLGLSGGATTGIAFTATPSILNCISGTARTTLTATTFTSTVSFLGPVGTEGAPTFSFSGNSNTGMFNPASNEISFTANGQERMRFIAGETKFYSGQTVGWTSGVASAALDLFLSRESAAVLQLGLDAAGVTNQMFKGPDRITSDGVGGDLTIAGGRNRGASAGGSIIFQTSPAAGAGVTGTLTTALTIDSTGFSTFAINGISVGGSTTTAAGSAFRFNGRSALTSASDGVLLLSNAAISDFTRLQFGGTTSSFPAIKRNSSFLETRLADDSGYAALATGQFSASQATLGNTVQSLISNATNDDPTETVFQGRTTTTDATPTTINTITIGTSFATLIECRVIARRTGGASGAAGDGGGYYVWVAVKNEAGTVTEYAAETTTTVGESTAGFNVTAAPSGATELIQVTGAATTNITWHSTCRTYGVNQ